MSGIKSKFFSSGKLMPPQVKSKLQDLIIELNDRQKVFDLIVEKRKQKEGLRTEEDVSERLAVELEEINRKKLVEQKMRQQLHENNSELQELERKLRSAYVAKALAAQVVEREALRKAEKTQTRRENLVMEKALSGYSEYERRRAEMEHKKKMQCKEGLLEQMAFSEQKKAKRYEDLLKEKELINEIMRNVNEEVLEEKHEKMSKKIAIQKDMEECMRLKEERKEKDRRGAEEAERQIAKFTQQKMDDAAQIKREKQREMKRKEDISAAIGQRIVAQDEEKRKKMELLLDLQFEEITATEYRKWQEEMEKKAREKIAARIKWQEDQEEINRRKQAEQEEDRKYREEQMRVMAEKDKLEQLSDEKRRRKLLEHRRALQQSFEERKHRRALEFSTMVKEREEEVQKENRRQERIEEERIRMLKEHAAVLRDYLPSGILKESDREHLSLRPKK